MHLTSTNNTNLRKVIQLYAQKVPRWRAWLLVVATLVSSVAVVLAMASPAQADPGCRPGGYYVIYARGMNAALFSPEQKAFLSHIHYLLPNAAWAEVGNIDGDVSENTSDRSQNKPDDPGEYPASNMLDYNNSVAKGVNELVTHLNDRYSRPACASETLILAGYSEGAEVVGTAMNRSDLSSRARSRIGYVALYGDPKFQGYDQQPIPPWVQGTNNPHHSAGGVFGTRQPYVPDWLTGRLGSWCDDDDGFCNGKPWRMGNHGTIYGNYWFQQSASTIVAMAKLKFYQQSHVPLNSLFTAQDIAAIQAEMARYSTLPFAVPVELRIDNLRPAALQYGSEMDVIQAGSDNRIYKDTWNGSKWSGFSSMDGTTQANPAVLAYGSELDIFVRGDDCRLYKNTWNNQFWSGWNSLGGCVVGAPSAVAYGSEMDVFVRGTTNEIWKNTWNGTSWSGWNDLGGNMAGNPVAIQYGNELDVFAKGGDGQLYKNTWNNQFWSGWNTLGGTLGGDPSPVVFGSELSVFMRSSVDGWVWKITWNGSSWSQWNPMGGTFAGNPVAVAYGSEMDVFVRGTNGRIYKDTWNGSKWSGFNDLGGNMVGDPAATQWNTELSVFARASGDRKIYKNTWNGSGWSGWNYLG